MTEPLETTASERLVHELTVASDASIGVIAVRCPETEVYRVVDELYSLAMARHVEFRLHTAELGWQNFERIRAEDTRAAPFDPLKPSDTSKTSAPVGKAFEELQNGNLPDAGYYVMLDLYFSFPDMQTQTCLRKHVQRSLANDQRLFVVVPNYAEIPDAIAPLVHVVEFGLPTKAELGDSLSDVLDVLEDELKPELDDDAFDSITSNGLGMTAGAFEAAVALAITNYNVTHRSMEGFGAQHIIDTVRDYKTQMLRKTNVLELQPTVDEHQIGGLDLFKEWMHQRKLTYTDKAKDAGVTPSRGALVVGPPGTGKSLVAKAAGSILNLPVIRFDVGRVFGQYVGQSEQSMRNVLKLLDAMAPCVLMLDEIDKGFAGMQGGGGDSGTTQRVFGTFLTWMQERDQRHRPVFHIMTANRVQGLPPELLRKGRIDETWSVNVPNDDEREEIIRIHVEKRLQSIAPEDLAAAVRITANLVGAEIEAMVEDALVLSLAEDEPGITFELLERAKDTLKPMHVTRAQEFEAMKEWAASNARPASSPMQSFKPTKLGSKAPRGIRRGRPARNKARVTRE